MSLDNQILRPVPPTIPISIRTGRPRHRATAASIVSESVPNVADRSLPRRPRHRARTSTSRAIAALLSLGSGGLLAAIIFLGTNT